LSGNSHASSPAPAPAASFRDPSGCLIVLDGRILRGVNPSGLDDLAAFWKAPSARRFLESGRIVHTEVLDDTAIAPLRAKPGVRELISTARIVLEHERIPFPSYPYEWAPEMLHAAGELTLDLARKLFEDGLGLKDGTPYNVLFRGPEPVFIDLLSFERRDADDATWLPYAQFVRTFLLPLAVNKYLGVPLDQIFTTRRDGLEPEEVFRWLKPLQKIKPPFFSLVSMPAWLASRHSRDDHSMYRKKGTGDPEKARFIFGSLLKGLSRTMERLRPRAGRASTWSDYMASNNNYSSAHFDAKQSFVEGVIKEFAPRRVLDVGCNTGHFSAMAARAGASVVAIDYDPVVVGSVWRTARAERLDILPLTVNLTRPSPGTGWRNQECPSFLTRARGTFDAVLMLAVIHHMLVSERVPLPEILDVAADLTTGLLVIEFIGPEDSMFRRLTRGRDALHSDLNHLVFESVARRRFRILRSQHIEGTHRRLYLLRKER
jgi:SAM-dependent methyltransferase